MIGLYAHAKHTALAQSIAAAGNISNLRCRSDQIAIAHDLRDSRCHLGSNRPAQGVQVRVGGVFLQNHLAEFTDRQRGNGGEITLVPVVIDQAGNVIFDQRVRYDL